MRPNLSIERLAVTLAALGTTAVVAACSRAEPAAVRPEPMPTASASPPPPPPVVEEKSATPMHRAPKPDKGATGQASCGAGTCTADPKKK